MAEYFIELFGFFHKEVIMVIISLIPLVGLRGSIPAGLLMDISPAMTIILGFPASLLPAPFIILLIKKIFSYLERISFFERYIAKTIKKNREKHSEKIEKYGLWGLFIIVSIPLPGTGVWSASLAAALFDLPFKPSLLIITLGNFVTAIAVLAISMSALSFF